MVLTLAILVLVLGLAVALFLAAGNEVRSVTYYKNSLGLRELSDTAVNLVMVQIKDATTANATAAPASRSTWASQPGMIRTYGSSTNAAMSYKLYSWDSPRVTGDDTTTVPATWSSTPALYTDLNEPIPSSSAPSDTNAYRYPIAYPPVSSNAPLGYSIASTAPLGAVSGATFTNSVPMPVQWLYILQDGTVANGTNASGNTVTISGATAANPIVGRIAYWADDETSKVNINTAAGGEYWGPLVQKNLRQLTNSYWLPTRWEYQRYPGHPARTDLQAVFPDLTRQQICAFTPRVSDNGATASTAMTTQPSSVAYDSDRLLASVGEARFSATNFSGGNRTDFTNNWSDRIERNKFLITASSRAPEVTLYGTPRVSIWPLSTITSTSNRTTLDSLFAFCSTIQKTTNAANPVIPTNRPYYFVRTINHGSTQVSLNGDLTNSINTTMFTYLDSLSGVSSIPGIGSVGITSKYELRGRDQLVTQFYDYIRCVNKIDAGLTNSSGTRINNFTGVSDSGAGFVMPVRRVTTTGTNYGFGRFHTINQVAIHFICTADGDIPIFPNWSASSNYTIGSRVTYAQRYGEARTNIVAIAPGSSNSASIYPWKEVFHLSLWSAPPPAPNANFSPNPPPPAIHANYTPILPGQRCIQAIAYIEPAMPGGGYPYSLLGDMRVNLDYRFLVSGLNSLSINGMNLGFHANAAIYPQFYPQLVDNVEHGRSGGIVKYLLFLTHSTFVKPPEARGGFTNPDLSNVTTSRGNITITDRGIKTNDSVNMNIPAGLPPVNPASFTNTVPLILGGSYPLVSSPIRITNGASMNLSSATINVTTAHKIASATFSNTYTVPFPAATIRMPTLPPNTNQWAFYPSGWDGTSTNGATSGGRFPILNTASLSWETNLIVPGSDTVFAVATKHGDYRISMARPDSAANWAPVPANPSFPSMQHRLFNSAYSGTTIYSIPGANYPNNAFGLLPPANPLTRPGIPAQADLVGLGVAHPLTYGDFDNGLAELPDGPYINSPDEAAGYPDGSYSGWWQSANSSNWQTNASFLTPSRKIASPVAFGSLPSAAMQDRPWQNLLFRPAPGVNHPGKAGFRIDGTSLTGAPPDHVWLDFFWMPVVEPWAISETFSTAGKINMNYQIAPFSYIRRTTGVQAVLRTSGVTAISSSAGRYTGGNYIKTDGNSGNASGLATSRSSGAPSRIRDQSPFPVNLDETLKGFDERLTNNAALFRTASEICELPIVPVAEAATYTSMNNGSWWTNWQYTGDNTKEATYNDIYPRLTTKGNTYTVHYRVQMLKKLPGGTQTTWDESRDKVLSELRGSSLIERYLDPNATYPDYATAFSTSPSLETFYKFRILQRSDFTP